MKLERLRSINKILIKYITNDLFYTALNQLWRLVSGPLMLFLIPIYLTAEQQGFWYTFSSLAALAVLADLGFSTIILQFAAHEFAYLKFNDNNEIVGEELHLKKLATLFVFCLKWSSGIIIIAFPIIFTIGFYMLSSKSTNVLWYIPWMIYCISSAIVFFNATILYFFEGCNLVGKVQNIRFKISVCTSSLMFLSLILKFDLYSLSFSLLANAVVGMYMICKNFGNLIKYLIAIAKIYAFSWKKEFLSLMWRYAISWASGYFIFQIYTPLTFQYHGAIEAGKVGISMALWTAIFSLSNVWVYAVTPKLNMYVSKKEWQQLDRTFLKNLLISCVTFLLGIIIVFVIMIAFQGKLYIVDRFLSFTAMICLASCWFLQLIINTLAVYLRAHKEELLVLPSFVSAIYIAITTLLCARYLSSEYLFLGYFSNYFFYFPWVLYIFRKRRKKHL
jgi:hypothetical protein